MEGGKESINEDRSRFGGWRKKVRRIIRGRGKKRGKSRESYTASRTKSIDMPVQAKTGRSNAFLSIFLSRDSMKRNYPPPYGFSSR